MWGPVSLPAVAPSHPAAPAMQAASLVGTKVQSTARNAPNKRAQRLVSRLACPITHARFQKGSVHGGLPAPPPAWGAVLLQFTERQHMCVPR